MSNLKLGEAEGFAVDDEEAVGLNQRPIWRLSYSVFQLINLSADTIYVI